MDKKRKIKRDIDRNEIYRKIEKNFYNYSYTYIQIDGKIKSKSIYLAEWHSGHRICLRNRKPGFEFR
jgi:hypothetical protein